MVHYTQLVHLSSDFVACNKNETHENAMWKEVLIVNIRSMGIVQLTSKYLFNVESAFF